MKTSVISPGVPRALPRPIRRIPKPSRAAPSCSTGRRITTTASTIRRSRSTSTRMLFMRGAGPIGYPGAAEVVNMQPPAACIKQGIHVAALHRRRPPVGHVGLALDPQRLAGSGGRRRAGAAEDRRPGAHRPEQGHRQYPDLGRRAGQAPRRRSQASGGYHYPRPPDAVAGNPARHGRPARRGHGAEARRQIPEASPRPRACRATTTRAWRAIPARHSSRTGR